MDAQSVGGLELGLVKIADAAFHHQSGGFMGEPAAAFAGAGLSVLTSVVHVEPPLRNFRRLYTILGEAMETGNDERGRRNT
jgi:hypothetical protein